jgi:hypothetical protein
MKGPTDYQRKIGALFYKIGVRGLLFVWNPEDGEWRRSTRPVDEFYKHGRTRKEIQRQGAR